MQTQQPQKPKSPLTKVDVLRSVPSVVEDFICLCNEMYLNSILLPKLLNSSLINF